MNAGSASGRLPMTSASSASAETAIATISAATRTRKARKPIVPARLVKRALRAAIIGDSRGARAATPTATPAAMTKKPNGEAGAGAFHSAMRASASVHRSARPMRGAGKGEPDKCRIASGSSNASDMTKADPTAAHALPARPPGATIVRTRNPARIAAGKRARPSVCSNPRTAPSKPARATSAHMKATTTAQADRIDGLSNRAPNRSATENAPDLRSIGPDPKAASANPAINPRRSAAWTPPGGPGGSMGGISASASPAMARPTYLGGMTLPAA